MSLHVVLLGLATGSALALALWFLFRLLPRISPDIRAWSWRLVALKLAISAFAIGQVTLHLLPSIHLASVQRLITRVAPVGPRMATRLAALPQHRVMEAILPVEPIVEYRVKQTFRAIAAAESIPAPIIKPQVPSAPNYRMIGLVAWGAGVAVFWSLALFGALRTRRVLQQVTEVTDPQIVEFLQAISARAELRSAPRLVCLDTAPGPMVCGIWKPTIVLPSGLADSLSEDLQLALGHEIAHIRRQDLLWAAVAWVVRSAFFFNPIAWLAEKELRAAQESATDQEAVWLTGASVITYGKMLLRAMSPERAMWQPAGLTMFDSFHNAQRRLQAMRHFSEQPHSFRKAAVAVMVAIGIGCLPSYLLVPARAASKPLGQAAAPTKTAFQTAARPDAAQTKQHQANFKVLPTSERGSQFATQAGHMNKSKPELESANPEVKNPSKQALIAKQNVPVEESLVKSSGIETNWPTSGHDRAFLIPIVKPQLIAQKEARTKSEPDIRFVEERSDAVTLDGHESPRYRQLSKQAAEQFNARVSELIQNQNDRIADYREGADQREAEAEQRESEAQQRKREGSQRDRAALLREQVIQANERDDYKIRGPQQRAKDAAIRREDQAQHGRDQYQLVLDQKQRETDAWQRKYDSDTVAAIRTETQHYINLARAKFQARIGELRGDEARRKGEAGRAAAFSRTPSALHYVKADSGLSFAIPDGYEVARLQATGNSSYTVVLTHKLSDHKALKSQKSHAHL